MVALYCRLSREDEHGNGDSSSIQTQKAMLSKYASDNNLGGYEFYVDDGKSGVSFERENFQRMITDMEDGKLSCIVTKDLSRLGRNYLEAGRYRELFAEYGVRYIAIADGHDSLNDDDGIATPIKEIIHEFYARECSKKMKAAFKSKAENGGVILGFAPYGYEKIPGTTNRLTPDENAPTVKRMFALALEGKGCCQIATVLTNEQILIPKAYREQKSGYNFTIKYPYFWASTTVRSILENPVYTGKLVFRRRSPKSFKDKTPIAQPKENWIITPDTHEALVNELDFETVQERIKSKQNPARNPDNIFRGLIFCKDCGSSLSYYKQRERHNARYRCCLNARIGKSACTAHDIREVPLKAIILADIQRHSSLAAKNADKYVAHLLQTSSCNHNLEKAANQRESQRCEKRLNEIDTLIQKLYEDRVFGVITDKRFAAMSANLETEQAELQKRFDELTNSVNNHREKSKNADLFVKLIQAYTDITELDSELLNSLIEKIVIHEKDEVDGEVVQRIDIFYRFIGNVGECVGDSVIMKSKKMSA